MSSKVFKAVVDQHQCAMRIFKENYKFETKQSDIVFYLDYSLRNKQSEQLADENRVATLNKKIAKRQILIDKLTEELEITKSVTKEDVCIE